MCRSWVSGGACGSHPRLHPGLSERPGKRGRTWRFQTGQRDLLPLTLVWVECSQGSVAVSLGMRRGRTPCCLLWFLPLSLSYGRVQGRMGPPPHPALPSRPGGSQFSLVAQSCLTVCDPMDCSMPGLPVHHQFPQFTQTHVHWVCDVIQPSHPPSSPSPPAFNHSQHQGFQVNEAAWKSNK